MAIFDFGEGPVEAHQHVNGGGWVADTAYVAPKAYVGPGAWVSGGARVSGEARVYGGVWGQSPLYIQGSKHAVTNCAPGKISVGCEVHSFDDWRANYQTIGRQHGYTNAQIAEYGRILEFVIANGR